MSTTLDVVFQHRATRDIVEINAWWRDNRPAAPDLFLLELRATVSIAALSPTLGAPAGDLRLAGVRRLILPRTRYHVYYRVAGQVLEILAVWHAVRLLSLSGG
jgi:plasmid stabilization system protein ParE